MPTPKRERNFVRTRPREDNEQRRPRPRTEPDEVDMEDAIAEWIDDYADEHSVFE